MRLRGGAGFRGFAGLQGDDGLACGERPGGCAHEGLGATDSLDEEADDLRVLVIDEVVHEIGEIEIQLIAAGEHGAEFHAPVGGGLHEELHHAAGLRDIGDPALGQAHQFVVGIAIEAVMQGVAAHAVGPVDDEPAARHEIADRLAARRAFGLQPLAQIARIDRGAFQTSGDAFFQHIQHGGRGHDDHRMARRLGQGGQIRVSPLAPDLGGAGVHGIDLAGEPAFAQIVENIRGPAGAF